MSGGAGASGTLATVMGAASITGGGNALAVLKPAISAANLPALSSRMSRLVARLASRAWSTTGITLSMAGVTVSLTETGKGGKAGKGGGLFVLFVLFGLHLTHQK